jgi:anti-sigma B factor antagonist
MKKLGREPPMSIELPPAPDRGLTIEELGTSDDGSVTIVCRGRLTAETSESFKSQVKDLALTHQYVMADLAGVDFVDSSGLGGVLAAFMSARSKGSQLKLVKVHPHVKDLLDMTRLASVLEKGLVP